MDETCCFCTRSAIDEVDERFPVCARSADACAGDKLALAPWSGAYEFPSNALVPDAALTLLAVGAA